MGNLANKFLEAVNIISDAKTKSAGFDRSVQVTIRKLYQEDSTKYEVEYEGALKTAAGAAGYKTNDVVWAVIPKNDLNQVLQIIGLASSMDANKQVLRSDDDEFEKITPNLATFITEWDLPHDDEGEGIQFIKTIWSATGSDDDNLITLQASKVIDAIKSSLYFEIGVIFESNIDLNINTNFGIRCYCNGVIDKPKFVLDINDIIGNPYNLIGEQQKKIFEITDSTDLISFDKIEFFAEDFSDSDIITLKGFAFYGCRDVDYMTGLAANLLVSEIENEFREIGGLSTNNYSLTTVDNLIFKANLRYDGVLVAENGLSKYTYKWYLKTLENGLPIKIAIGDNPNTKDIVETWYFDKEESDDRIIPSDWFDTIKDAPNQLKVSAAAFFMPNSWIWCEVIDEKGNKVKTVEGWIDNADKSYELELTAERQMNGKKFQIKLSIKNDSSLPTDLKYVWYKDDKVIAGKTQPILTFDVEDAVYKCEVYTENNFLVFTETYQSYYIPDVPDDTLSLVITGKTLYLCKADGKFQGEVEPLKIWIYDGGKPVSDISDYTITWSIPEENTMLMQYTPAEGENIASDIFKFNVHPYFLHSYTDNTITVEVKDSKNNPATGKVEISFLKNGQPGTNGTDIVCTFIKNENQYQQPIDYYQTQESISKDTLSVRVFRANAEEQPFTMTSTVIDMVALAKATTDEEKEEAILDLDDEITISEPTCLKATCKSGDGESTWYAYLPIVINTDALELIEPSAAPYVQFSSGGNIAEDMPKTFTCSENISSIELDSKYLEAIYSTSEPQSSFKIQVKENIVFKGDEILPILTITSTKGHTLKVPILLLTNRFEYAAINGWDGTSIKLDEENNTILAPMAGFGKKEEDNSFTGVVLGDIISDKLATEEVDELPPANDADFNTIYKDKSQENSYYVLRTKDGKRQFVSSPPPDFQGIIGLNSGEQTFSLNANDGSAWFKGHIEATSGKIGSVAIDAVMPTNISGSYSWKFSPTDGLFMWNGTQDENNLVFSITKEDGLHMNGSGTFTGTINASQGGNIGGFTITPPSEGVQGKLISTKVGIGSYLDDNSYAFWAGHSDFNTAPFRVKHDGTIFATKGFLGTWEITTLGLKSSTFDEETNKTYSIYLNNYDYYWHNNNSDTERAADVLVFEIHNKQDDSKTYPFYIWKDGTFVATNAQIGGSLSGVSGDFSNLKCGSDTGRQLLISDSIVGYDVLAVEQTREVTFWMNHYNSINGVNQYACYARGGFASELNPDWTITSAKDNEYKGANSAGSHTGITGKYNISTGDTIYIAGGLIVGIYKS